MTGARTIKNKVTQFFGIESYRASHTEKFVSAAGGATALSAVVGGASVHEPGYQYAITPVLINVVVILAVAIIFNYAFKWRHYPTFLARKQTSSTTNEAASAYNYGSITHEDFVYALSQFDTLLDVSENDLLTIYNLVTKRHMNNRIQYKELIPGHYYSNAELGENWSVRQIIDWADSNDTGEEKLIYKIVAGTGRRNTGVLTKNEFSNWAEHEIITDEENWRRVDTSGKISMDILP